MFKIIRLWLYLSLGAVVFLRMVVANICQLFKDLVRLSLYVQEIIHATLNDHLGGKLYEAQKVSNWSKNIADSVKSQVKTLGYDRWDQRGYIYSCWVRPAGLYTCWVIYLLG